MDESNYNSRRINNIILNNKVILDSIDMKNIINDILDNKDLFDKEMINIIKINDLLKGLQIK